MIERYVTLSKHEKGKIIWGKWLMSWFVSIISAKNHSSGLDKELNSRKSKFCIFSDFSIHFLSKTHKNVNWIFQQRLSLVPGTLCALVLGPNRNSAIGPGPKCNGPWSLGPFGQMSLVPGTPFRASILSTCMTSQLLVLGTLSTGKVLSTPD